MDIGILIKIAGIGLLTAIVSIILKKSDKDEIATFATLAGIIIVVVLIVDMLGGLFDTVKSIFTL
ncbi:MAG: stage III sporulation protein AC [Acidaminococcus sp.]|nr:stage III sporulation protein AC [Acidaminococcus sp.]MDY4559233.1 stage III sporulation protein AC [Eubacteriales bacterium]MDY5345076.1 stage III sporulation protein AC [Eubacteriales bacterium]